MNELFEKLAAIEHERWSDWQKHMHSKCIPMQQSDGDPCLMIPSGFLENLERQIATPYADLSEKEKESDRDQVRRYWPIIQSNTPTL